MSKNLLVTGCLGFYGFRLVKRMIEHGYEVVGIDNMSRNTHDPEDFEKLNEQNKGSFSFSNVDIRDKEEIIKTLKKRDFDVIVHLAAVISIDESMNDPYLYQTINDSGSLNIAKAILESGNSSKVIYASSSEVYGNPVYAPMDEEHPLFPRSFYAAAKLAGEKYLQVLNHWYGIPVLIIRNFNTFGPGQPKYILPSGNYSAVIPNFVSRMIRREQPVISGDGTQTRDFLYIDDAVDAYVNAIESGKNLGGEVINIGTGIDVSMNHIAELIAKILHMKVMPIYSEARAGEVIRLIADVSKAKKLLNWEPKTPLEVGLRKTIDYERRN